MNVRIIAVGKLKEKYLKTGIDEYVKRLKGYTKVEIVEVADERIPDNPSEADNVRVKDKEGERVLARIGPRDHVILLDVGGKMLDSEEFSSYLETKMTGGESSFTFVLGGSLGHSPAVYQRADMKLSMSKMTFPHQLARLILLEQIYRAFKIMRHETYHK